MHTSFDYARPTNYASRFRNFYRNTLAEFNRANKDDGFGVDYSAQWRTPSMHFFGLFGLAGSGDGLKNISQDRIGIEPEDYRIISDVYRGPDLAGLYRRTRHSPLP